jgi:Protein of unknown function (DUF1559)
MGLIDYGAVNQVFDGFYIASGLPVPANYPTSCLGALQPNNPTALVWITDGTSNTIMIAEDAGQPSSWASRPPGPSTSRWASASPRRTGVGLIRDLPTASMDATRRLAPSSHTTLQAPHPPKRRASCPTPAASRARRADPRSSLTATITGNSTVSTRPGPTWCFATVRCIFSSGT